MIFLSYSSKKSPKKLKRKKRKEKKKLFPLHPFIKKKIKKKKERGREEEKRKRKSTLENQPQKGGIKNRTVRLEKVVSAVSHRTMRNDI